MNWKAIFRMPFLLTVELPWVAEWTALRAATEVLAAKDCEPLVRFAATEAFRYPSVCITWRSHHRRSIDTYIGLFFHRRTEKWNRHKGLTQTSPE